jgi:hypothetical protein
MLGTASTSRKSGIARTARRDFLHEGFANRGVTYANSCHTGDWGIAKFYQSLPLMIRRRLDAPRQ